LPSPDELTSPIGPCKLGKKIKQTGGREDGVTEHFAKRFLCLGSELYRFGHTHRITKENIVTTKPEGNGCNGSDEQGKQSGQVLLEVMLPEGLDYFKQDDDTGKREDCDI